MTQIMNTYNMCGYIGIERVVLAEIRGRLSCDAAKQQVKCAQPDTSEFTKL